MHAKLINLTGQTESYSNETSSKGLLVIQRMCTRSKADDGSANYSYILDLDLSLVFSDRWTL